MPKQEANPGYHYYKVMRDLHRKYPNITAKDAARIVGCSLNTAKRWLPNYHADVPKDYPGSRKISKEKFEEIVEAYLANPELNLTQLAKLVGVSTPTVGKYIEIARVAGKIPGEEVNYE